MKAKKLAVFSHACALRVNRKIYRIMADEGFDVEIYFSEYPGRPYDPAEEGLPVTKLLRKGARTRYHYYPGLAAILDKTRPDIVLLDLEPDSFLAFQLASWTSKNQARFILQTCENLPIWQTTAGKSIAERIMLSLVRRMILRYVTPRINHAFAISQKGKSLLESFGMEGRASVIPLGVDTLIFKPDPLSRNEVRASWGVDENTPVVSYFGRLVPEKGIDLLINALIKLKHLPWMFAMDQFETEDDAYSERISKLLENEAFADRLIWIHAKHGEVPRYMNAADIIVCPSLRLGGFLEQYGRVIPEGLACGAEVITSDTGAFPEIGDGQTRIFPEGSDSELLDRLKTAITRPNRDRMADADRQYQHILATRSLNAQWALMKTVIKDDQA